MHDRDKETEQLNNDELAECKSLSRDAGNRFLHPGGHSGGVWDPAEHPAPAVPSFRSRRPRRRGHRQGGGLSRTSRSAPGGGAGGGPFEADGPVEEDAYTPGGRGGRRRDRPGGGLSEEESVLSAFSRTSPGRPTAMPTRCSRSPGVWIPRRSAAWEGAHSGHRPGEAPPEPPAGIRRPRKPEPPPPTCRPRSWPAPYGKGAEGDAACGRVLVFLLAAAAPVPAGCSRLGLLLAAPRWTGYQIQVWISAGLLGQGTLLSLDVLWAGLRRAPPGGGWRWTPWPPCRSCSPWPTP